MSSSAFPTNHDTVLVADASVIINLNASGYVRQIIGGIPGRWIVPANASVELEVGARFGHDDGKQLDILVAEGVANRIEMGKTVQDIYESLLDGSRGQTLDDGEAATIAVAIEHSAIALLDEKKARRMCQEQFPDLQVRCTAELLLNAAHLEQAARVEAIVNALQKGRMRVPVEFAGAIVSFIGPEQAANCLSLPRIARQSAA
jgi:predicted nucleic acid-binding protein